MSDKIEKFLKRLTDKRRITLLTLIARIRSGDFSDLHIKKMQGIENRYRIRKGDMRIKYSLNKVGQAVEIEVEWRSDTTYNL